jgi:putative ABC transport system permease protein
MIKNYFVIAWRNITRNGTFYFINIFGLALGLACCLLIGSYLYSELTFDSAPEHASEIYRVELHVLGNGSVVDYPFTDWGVGPGIKNTYPEVIASTRLTHGFKPYLKYKETTFREEHLAVVDSNFLEMFSIPLLEGSDKTALVQPNSMVVTKAFAQKYFGEEDPIGKALQLGEKGEFKITGLINNISDRSHFHFDAFVSLSTLGTIRESWSNIGVFTYIQLHQHADPKGLEAKFPDLVSKYIVPEVQNDMGVSLAEAQKSVESFHFSLRPLRSIHLNSHTAYEMEANGDIKYIYIFGALAIFILLLACVNFTNLATASSSKRSREVGIRKVMGSVKRQLIIQFLTESVLLALCAMVVAYLLVWGLLPFFNDLTGKAIPVLFFIQPVMLGIILIGLVFVGVVAGIYPAFFLSSFKTTGVLKGNTGTPGKSNFLRRGLVIFQFAVSTAMIVATIVVYRQLDFMQNKKLGYDKEQVMVIHQTNFLGASEKVFKENLMKDSRVIRASLALNVPGWGMDGTQAFGKDQRENENHAEIHIDIMHVDYDFLSTLGISLASGRNLSLDFPSDSSAVVINETAAREFGWDNDKALNMTILTSGQFEYHVVGVVKDFNYASVRDKIAPLVMMLPRAGGNILVKLNTADLKTFVESAKHQWTAFGTGYPFVYSFLDEHFSAMYFAEERTGKIFSTFAVIALVIAGMGLFGLSAFTAEKRTKEIGIRKALGASVSQVLYMLSREFLILVSIAIVIAVPGITWAMNLWLRDFPYRITVSWWVFVAAAGISWMIAFLSMCFQSMKAAVRNPVESLRSE